MRHVRYFVLLTLVSLVPALVFAGEQANAPSITGETGLFTLLSADTIPRGNWDFGLYFNNWDPLIRLDPGQGRSRDVSLDWSRLSASLGYGLTDRWEFSVMVPYENYTYSRSDLLATDPNLNARDLGNVRVGTKWRLIGMPGDNGGLALNVFAELATGKDTVASKDTGFGAGLDWSHGNWAWQRQRVGRMASRRLRSAWATPPRSPSASTGSPRWSVSSTAAVTGTPAASSRTGSTSRPAAVSGWAPRRTGPSTSACAPTCAS